MRSLLLGWLLTSCAGLALAATGAEERANSVSRHYGLLVGDRITQQVRIAVPATHTLERSSLPKNGRANRWMELQASEVAQRVVGNEHHYDVTLRYQIMTSDETVSLAALPRPTLRFVGTAALAANSASPALAAKSASPALAANSTSPASAVNSALPTSAADGSSPAAAANASDGAAAAYAATSATTLTMRLSEQHVSVSPISDADAWDREGLQALRPERGTPLLNSAATRQRIAAYVAALTALSAYWLYRLYGVPFLARSRGPFARARRALHRVRGADAAAMQSAMRELHRAFDTTFGATLFHHGIETFLAQYPRYGSLREPIQRFFALSRSRFYETATPTHDDAQLAQLRELAQRLSLLERGLT